MKNFSRYLFVLLPLVLSSASMLAQTEQTLYSIGFIGGQKKVSTTNNTFSYSTGNVGSTPGYVTVSPGEALMTTGFPYNVLYFRNVFDRAMFVSKGYFGDHVQLQWNVVNLANSIKRFKVYRKVYGDAGDSTIMATLSPETYSWNDEFAEKGVIYEYTLFVEGLTDKLRIPFLNTMQGIGFALPTGRASGSVAFEGGTAVEGVAVLAETEGSLTGKSLSLNGTDSYCVVPHLADDDELELRQGFTFQAWCKWEGSTRGVIFSKGSQYELSVEDNQLSFKVNDATVLLPFTPPVDSFFHVSAVYKPASHLALYAYVTGDRVDSVKVTAGAQPAASFDNILFGKNNAGNFFQGHLDELRLFNKPLSYAQIKDNFSRYINFAEPNIAGYWRLNEGLGNQFYDYGRKGFTFYENHATIFNVQWSNTTPGRDQLAFRGVTDASGNYIIAGFPYETDGSLYKFTPVFGAHQFEPSQQIRLISDETATVNALNFKDISSFEVTGTIKYRNTAFPVEGVGILVDGKPATNSDAQLITTDNFGRFSLRVPIGHHSLKLSLQGHTFEFDGRFPLHSGAGPIATHDFQLPVNGLEFTDISLVKVAGRVTGGPVEGGKLLGFGRSSNNLGNAVINLTTEKGFDISLSDSTHHYAEEHMTTSANFNTKNVKVFPDVNTGEYVAYLLPEKYKVTGVTAGAYIFDANFNVTVNLKETFGTDEILKDTLGGTLNGTPVAFPPFDPTLYDTVVTTVDGLRTWLIGVDTFVYQQKQYFIYRTTPSISVLDQDNDELFGDEEFVYQDNVLNVEETIPLIQNGAYTFGHPVFNDRQAYTMFIQLFEEYTNNNTGLVSKVPVSDGKLEIVNNLAMSPDKVTIALDANGRALYRFNGGLPEINLDNINPGNSYTKTLNITAFSGNDGSIQTIWRQSDPLRGFLFSGMPRGNNFVTTGPTQVITILRDPPGSSSLAFLESGMSTSRMKRWSVQNTFGSDFNFLFKFGTTVTTFAGVGAGVISEIKNYNDLNVGVEVEERWLDDSETVYTTTTTKRWETSASSSFVGDKADVFVGYASNIVYGISSIVGILPQSSCINCIPGTYTGTAGTFSIGLKDGLRLSPELTTGFMHTQGHIEEQIIPNLKKLRNSFLVYSPDPSSVPPKVVTSPSDEACTDNAIYVSLVPITDPLYGTSNQDTVAWGSAAVRDRNNLGNGPSYKIIKATGCTGYYTKDTIHYFNQQIKDWLYWLEENERQKVVSNEQVENLAFDAGAVFHKTVTMDTATTSTQSFEWFIKPSVATTAGFTFNDFGLDVNIKVSYGHTESFGVGSGSTASTTYGYTLADSEPTDYYSVNVRKPDDGFGPIFRVNGGVTSCPYQGEYETQYYRPGGHGVVLSPATVAVDAPLLEVEQAVATDIASNRPADFNLLLKNNSGIEEDRWYTLRVDDATNPFGAIIEIDGAPISSGRTIFVKAGETLQKTLRVRMGRADIMSYEDLRLVLTSQCDDGIEDDVEISVFFIPGCSDIAMTIPTSNWVMNTNITPVDSLSLNIGTYDLSHDNFKQIVFQYKPSGSSQWTTDMIFYNPEKVTQAEFDAAQDPKQWISGPSILYYWDMHSQPDRNYDLRAKTLCELGPAVFVETATDIMSGIKDVKRPVLFGSPQPADGVVSAGEEISIRFDETIEASLLTPFNFSVQAVLNGYPLNHNTSVEFDGVNDNVKMSEGLNLSSSFTIEFWIKRNEVNKRQVIFSKGEESSDMIELGFSAGNRFFVKLGQQEILTSNTFTETDWYHYAVSYDATDKVVSAYRDDKYILTTVAVSAAFSGLGPISLGKPMFAEADLYKGNLHDLRIWKKALSFGDVYAKMSQSLGGNELYLAGYWPFDEAHGRLAHDNAHFRHGSINADWLVLPKGRGFSFDGTDDYLRLNTGSTVIISDEMDFTVEFWFKGAPGQQNVTMFSSGKGDGTDNFNGGSWSIGFNDLGQLQLLSNALYVTVDNGEDILNDNWHHLAVSVSRKGNTNIYIDGVLAKAQASAGLGALFGGSMWLGARGFKISTATTVHDQYFKGALDEFRIWNFVKKQNQVELAMNAKLIGDEPGLTAYYPFEFYSTVLGVKVLNPTLADQWQNPNGPNGGTATPSGGADYSILTPNIKDSRPLQKVDFDWTVNDDKIIITPSPSMAAAIEKTLLEITVSRIEDKYENRIASPISWTAFIDRNQMKWSDDVITLEKKLYEPLTFKTEIINHGGTQQNFVINNLPVWLTASPQSGIIAALSTVEVTFTVNEGLNTGMFQEDLYLKTDFGYDEKLILNLRNYTPIPADWKVDPDKFQYSMNVDGQIKVNNKISSNPFDYLAAFVNDECRGVAQLQYVEAFDNYQAFLTVYSNALGGEPVDFKIWNANEGQIYTNVTPVLSFVSNAVHGSPSSPVIFESVQNLIEHKVVLPPGWKWTSFNLYSALMERVNDVITVPSTIGDQIKSKLYYDTYSGPLGETRHGWGWVGSLSTNGGLKNEEMYKTYMNHGLTFTYSGKFPGAVPITITEGWNWIGFISMFNLNVNEALASLNASAGDLVKGQHNFATYEPAMGWIGSLTYMKPGEGYMYKAQGTGTLIYPLHSSLSSGRVKDKEENDYTPVWEVKPYDYPDNMNAIAEVVMIDGMEIEADDQLGAFADGECRGVARPVFNPLTNRHNFFITFSGNADTRSVQFRYHRSSEGRQFMVNESVTWQANTLIGNNKSPLALTLNNGDTDGALVYPNPFTKDLGIDLLMIQDSWYHVAVTDLTGRIVRQLQPSFAPAGVINLKWDGRNNAGTPVSTGVYIISVTINGVVNNYRVIRY